TGMLVKNCPLVEFQVFESREEAKPVNVYCLHLRRGERDFGVLNLYLPEKDGLPESSQEFMQALLDEAALVLESIRLRNRELSVIEQLRNQTDLKILEMDFIENVKEALKADFVLLQYLGGQEQNPRIVSKGDLPEAKMTIIDSLIDNVSTSELPILLGEVDGDPGLVQGVRSIIAVPLTVPDEPAMGVIVVGNYGSHKFNSRHLALLQTLSGQISLVIKNSRLQAETEFKIIISERKRLAREIHDGLAQTLGFLKLQTAQMENLLVANERDRLQESLSTTYRVLSEAYIEVRQAIDGLRISPNGEGLASWVKDTCLEFEDNTGLMVDIEGFSGKENLPLEVQLQLVRIIQEALSNVRKHACAKQAWVSYYQTNEEAIIDIRDDGRGFSPEDIPGVSRYGLQGMRERTELIGGEFQVISQVDKGTTIRVRVPIIAEE
ncbi:MAG: GAF domain-containing sensor histidine kinase, partial [Chloroflexota bacterium]